MGLPYGLLTRWYACCCMPIFVFPPPCGVRLAGGQDAMTHRRRGFGLPVLPFNPVIFQRPLPRRSGPPGVSTGYFQRTIVKYTGLNHLTDRGLYPVLRTRPDLAPPQICLPSTLSDTGHTCTSTHAFASGFLQARISATPLPLAILPLRQGGSGLCPIFVSKYRTSPFSSRAKPGTHRDREEPHSSPLPPHAAYGSVLRESADQASSDPGERKSK
jgi:hypothetical protein